MDAIVLIEFGMEGASQLVAVARSHDATVDLRHYPTFIIKFGDEGGAYEGHGYVIPISETTFRTKAPQLSSVGVTFHGDRHGGETHHLYTP